MLSQPGKGNNGLRIRSPYPFSGCGNFCGERAAVTKNAEDNDGNGLGDDEAIGEGKGTCLTRADSTQPRDDYDDLSDWEDSRMGAQTWTVAEAKANSVKSSSGRCPKDHRLSLGRAALRLW
jgi:hypothetical protein